MAKRKARAADGMIRYSTFLRPDQLQRLRAVHTEHGVPVAEQIRRAIDTALAIKRGGGRP
jgi:hypothetical protein